MKDPIKATDSDLSTIEQALDYVWHPRLDFIFQRRSHIQDTLVLTFDDSSLYVWRRERDRYVRYVFPLICETGDFSHDWWACGPVVKGLETCLPSEWVPESEPLQFVSGALLTPFIHGQKLRSRANNPYTSHESYLATIMHEFGHAYFNCAAGARNSYVDNEVLACEALKIYRGETGAKQFYTPTFGDRHWGEIFAFCTDRAASNIFWPQHRAEVDSANAALINDILNKKGNAYWDRSFMENPHLAALVIGPLLLESSGNDWPGFILDSGYNTRILADGLRRRKFNRSFASRFAWKYVHNAK